MAYGLELKVQGLGFELQGIGSRGRTCVRSSTRARTPPARTRARVCLENFLKISQQRHGLASVLKLQILQGLGFRVGGSGLELKNLGLGV